MQRVPSWPAPVWVVAVDLGQSVDPTAIAVLEVSSRLTLEGPQCVTAHDADLLYAAHARAPDQPGRIDVRHLERLPLRMSYPDQINYVASLLNRAPLDRLAPALVVDQTGVGRPVVDMFRHAGLYPEAVTITAGDGEGPGDGPHDHRVSKLRLVSRLQASLHAGTLRIAKELKEARALVEELQNFRATISEAGYARFGARSGQHDDLVLAVAIGAWWATRPEPTVTISTFD